MGAKSNETRGVGGQIWVQLSPGSAFADRAVLVAWGKGRSRSVKVRYLDGDFAFREEWVPRSRCFRELKPVLKGLI